MSRQVFVCSVFCLILCSSLLWGVPMRCRPITPQEWDQILPTPICNSNENLQTGSCNNCASDCDFITTNPPEDDDEYAYSCYPLSSNSSACRDVQIPVEVCEDGTYRYAPACCVSSTPVPPNSYCCKRQKKGCWVDGSACPPGFETFEY
ncbi:MAG: hypothetical protein NZO16_05870, partial [Deltaproteobacteria bacterium]|nr:hypothetical protein [Deltaproteobacteria bacterium]